MFWLVDPLDGTREFIKRNDEFTVNIALVCDGKPILGVITAPALSLAYVGGVGVVAQRRDANGDWIQIEVELYQRADNQNCGIKELSFGCFKTLDCSEPP